MGRVLAARQAGLFSNRGLNARAVLADRFDCQGTKGHPGSEGEAPGTHLIAAELKNGRHRFATDLAALRTPRSPPAAEGGGTAPGE